MTGTFELHRGSTPLVLSIPHSGQELIHGLAERLTSVGKPLADTDRHLDRLYDFAKEFGATVISARYSRYVVDLNRDPSGASLYPGMSTTELVPLTTFDGEQLYLPGAEPTAAEIAERRREYFDPYHAALAAEIARVKSRHGLAVLYDCHSIRSVIPRFFDGELPVLNLGTDSGRSCAPDLQAAVVQLLQNATAYSHVVNGRFKGGWITRGYGRPAECVQALQMELAWRAYMQESPPFAFDESKANNIRVVLRGVLERILLWADTQARALHR